MYALYGRFRSELYGSKGDSLPRKLGRFRFRCNSDNTDVYDVWVLQKHALELSRRN